MAVKNSGKEAKSFLRQVSLQRISGPGFLRRSPREIWSWRGGRWDAPCKGQELLLRLVELLYRGRVGEKAFSSGEGSYSHPKVLIGDYDRNLEPEGWSRQDDGRDQSGSCFCQERSPHGACGLRSPGFGGIVPYPAESAVIGFLRSYRRSGGVHR